MTEWPNVPLHAILSRAHEWIDLAPDAQYRRVTIRLHGRGVVQRDVVSGGAMAGQKRLMIRSGQLILSKIDARNGAIGIVPADLDGAIVSSDFPTFSVDRSQVDPTYLGWMCRTRTLVAMCRAASEGTTNRVRLKEDRFLNMRIPLPPLAEQLRIVAHIDAVAARVQAAQRLRQAIEIEQFDFLVGVYRNITTAAPRFRMDRVAPLTRRPVSIDPSTMYHELGVRSFGKGTFHKPAISGADLAAKKVYWLKPGDLVFNIVFAWERAVAVVQQRDDGRIGSHRFLACVPRSGIATAGFLWLHFMTAEGLEQLGEASPGGAGRNRTLGLEALARIEVPIPPYGDQLRVDDLLSRVTALKQTTAGIDTELAALVPAVLESEFGGDLRAQHRDIDARQSLSTHRTLREAGS